MVGESSNVPVRTGCVYEGGGTTNIRTQKRTQVAAAAPGNDQHRQQEVLNHFLPKPGTEQRVSVGPSRGQGSAGDTRYLSKTAALYSVRIATK
uniref:Uncharacterized protein n=1 Tax=Anopheles minimus TaxID=112268 RepID=A0A182WNL6_9DIPT